MTNQQVPLEPRGCYLDYTYCASEHCENKCGRKISDAIKDAISKMEYSRISFSNFCDVEDYNHNG